MMRAHILSESGTVSIGSLSHWCAVVGSTCWHPTHQPCTFSFLLMRFPTQGFSTATVVTLSCLCGAYRSRGRMKCSICHYEAREDGVSGHTARQCPLNNKECRHTLSEDHPFYKPGQCINPGCEQVRQCNVCHMVGHTAAALRLTTCRWSLTSDRRVVPKVNTPVLTPSAFVYPLMTAASVAELLHFVHLLGH